MQKVADDKGLKVKKGGAKGKKDDGPAQNGDTKTNEVWKKEKMKGENVRLFRKRQKNNLFSLIL